MTDRRWRKWELTGLFLTLIFGNLLHFVYDWSGQNSVVAAFAAVNESTWEHMKLLAMPWVIWSLVEAVALRSSRQSVLMARALGLLAGLVTIPTVYYTYTGALGVSSMIVDVVLFQAAVLLGALVSWRVLAKNKLTGPIWGAVGLLLLLGVAALFAGERIVCEAFDDAASKASGRRGAVRLWDVFSAGAAYFYRPHQRHGGTARHRDVRKETGQPVSFS